DSFFKRSGVHPGRMIEERCPDMKYLGHRQVDITLGKYGKTKMRLLHPGGGSAYAISYRPQKIAEALSGGEKPNIMGIGHFHKIESLFYRNIHLFQCFEGNTKILTKEGRKKIRQIKIGEEVLTHKNRWKKVINTFTRIHRGNFIRIYFGRNLKNGNFKYGDTTAITCTEDHPILVLRNNIKQWIPAKEILLLDKLYVPSNQCKYCEKYVPHWRKACTKCIDNNKRLSKEKSELKYIQNDRGGGTHFKNNILPRARELLREGYKVFPLGNTIPDIIAFKDNKLIVIELEKQWIKHGKHIKYDKYKEFIDEIKWEIINKGTNFPEYDYDQETKFAIVPIVKIIEPTHRNRRVYNLEVEEDNSYIAAGVVVHNCGTFQSQTSFMKEKAIAAHKGSWILDVDLCSSGTVKSVKSELIAFYE
ncbi:MAG: hypothetical protein AABY22_11110, partial [Nanoarchaeota archaeon]